MYNAFYKIKYFGANVKQIQEMYFSSINHLDKRFL